MSPPKLSLYQGMWICCFIVMLGVAVPRYRTMTLSSRSSSENASLEIMCRAQLQTEGFPEQFTAKIKNLPPGQAILLVQTTETRSSISSLIAYLAWPRPVLVRTAVLRESIDLDALLRGRIAAILLANQEAPSNLPTGEKLGPNITYIPLQSGS